MTPLAFDLMLMVEVKVLGYGADCWREKNEIEIKKKKAEQKKVSFV